MTTFTPGPYTIQPFVGPNAASYIRDNKDQLIAIVPGSDVFPGGPLGNAKLLAAAPLLFDALKTIIRRGYKIEASDYYTAEAALKAVENLD